MRPNEPMMRDALRLMLTVMVGETLLFPLVFQLLATFYSRAPLHVAILGG